MFFNGRNVMVIFTSVAILSVAIIGYYTIVLKVAVFNTSTNGTELVRRPVQETGSNVTKADYDKDRIHDGDVTMGVDSGEMIDLDSAGPQELLDRTVIVTAISQNHLEESKAMVASVQTFWPNKTIILYDLGLSPSGVREVKRLCNVEYRYFNFTKYPSHVKDLKKYAWKPLIIRDTLREFGIVFWCDASARFRQDPLVLFSVLKEQRGFLTDVEEYNSTLMIARTHPKMFKQLGVDRETFRRDVDNALYLEANRLLLPHTDLVRTKIIAPWVNCSLRPECISPKGSVLRKHVAGPRFYTHLYDQAALNLIVYRNLKGLFRKENDRTVLFEDVVKRITSPQGSEKVKICKPR